MASTCTVSAVSSTRKYTWFSVRGIKMRRSIGRRGGGHRRPGLRTWQREPKVRSSSSVKSVGAAGRCLTHHASILSACCCALLPIRSFTSGSHLGDEVEAVHVVASLEVFDPFVDGLKQSSPLLRIEIIVDGK